MKTHGLGKRLMALFLALTLFVSLVPVMSLRASAAKGDITSGSTGLVGGLNTNDTISWPIKIYDYMNDGMLFEYSSSETLRALDNLDGGYSYGGGETMPMIDNIVTGVDYTSYKGYYKNTTTKSHAFLNWGHKATFDKNYDGTPTEVVRSIVQPKKDVSPMYMHYNYTAGPNANGDYGKTYGWVSNFAKDDSRYYSKSDLRYMVIVYRTNDVYGTANNGKGHNVRAFWAVSDGAYSSSEDISKCHTSLGWSNSGMLHSGQTYLKPSTTWAYQVIDMKTDYNTDYGIASNWDKIGANRIAGVGITLPLAGTGEEMDISHIAYFSTSGEAKRFGRKAVAFDNDPGEYMGYKITMTHSVANNSVTTTVSRSADPVQEMWNMGANQAFTMLWASTGGGWLEDDNVTGGSNTWTNGYYSYMIGKYMGGTATHNYNKVRDNVPDGKGYVVSDSIFTMNQGSVDYDMSQLDLGYTLYNTLSKGVMTAGLLQSGMVSYTGVDGKDYRIMNYKADTVAYIATLLRDTLIIPERDYWGYNYNFVKGSPSVEYYEDIDGDGRLDVDEDLDGDGHLDVFEDKNFNGVLDRSEDLDGDGNLDVFEDLDFDGIIDPAEDLDGDGHIDVFEDIDMDGVLDPGEDVDGDGKLDTIEYFWNEKLGEYEWRDLNGNGIIDMTEDVNGNGKLDLSEDRDKDGKLDGITATWDHEKKAWVDSNGNPMAHEDLLKLTEDMDGNGALDRGEDLDGDGRLDCITAVWNSEKGYWEDKNGNQMSHEALLKLTEDIDGDGRLDKAEDRNGNGKLDSCDLATALREDLGITFASTIVSSSGAPWQGTYTANLGSYNGTQSRMMKTDANGKTYNGLIGPYLQCKENIKTFYDAAYYLLHNLFVDNSYNQVETDYRYLVMAKATVKDGGGAGIDKEAYVFDAGFTYDDQSSGIVYDKDKGTISAVAAENKHQIQYGSSASYKTTLNPFLPIDDEGEPYGGEFGVDGTPYFRDDGAASIGISGDTYQNRNYNYVMAANGEMIYHYDDDLFFRFQGDDDVYMFINGELVLDICAAHSITDVGFEMNDYVDVARKVLKTFTGYEPGMSDEELATVLKNNNFTTSSTKKVDGKTYDYSDILRLHKLNLVDGRSYTVDFYYMERHGWGANMSIATNIVMTDPTLETEKNAYQGTDINGDPEKVEYGSLIDDAQPVNYEFAITNTGNTKLYKLSFQDDRIGVDMTYDGGLHTYGKPTIAQFSVGSDTTMSVTGLIGAFNLDGEAYIVDAEGNLTNKNGASAGTSVPITADVMHTLKIYQLNNPVLHKDVTASIKLGGNAEYYPEPNSNTGIYTLAYGRVNKIPVAGIRVTDAKGGVLDPSDLTITIEGYASLDDYKNGKPITPIKIKVNSNEELMKFLTSLEDPQNQTQSGEGVPIGKSSLYWGSGLWQYASVTISGMYYSLSPEEQEAKVFNNTVYTSGYKSIEDNFFFIFKATNVFYSPGEAMYYQWAGHTVYLEKDRLWKDVLADSTDPSNPLFEQGQGIQVLNNAGLDTLQMEITDSSGDPLRTSENLYSNGSWSAYIPDTIPPEFVPGDGERCIYFRNTDTWANVNVYYWSSSNTGMVVWPGDAMSTISGNTYAAVIPADAEYVIFNNGNDQKTSDLPLPVNQQNSVSVDAANDVVNVNFTATGKHMFYIKITSTAESAKDAKAMVPVIFHVTSVKDSTYVLDYGLRTEDLNTLGQMFSQDDLLGWMGGSKAALMGVTTKEPSYMGTYSAALSGLGNINRINFMKEHGMPGAENSIYLDASDGKYYIGGEIPTDGTAIKYNGGRYTLDRRIWFEPSNFMDEEYDLWLAISVYNQAAAAPSAIGATGMQYHEPGIANDGPDGYQIDIGSEVQMYKKVTVLPATVVYYEDDFQGVEYNNMGTGDFVHHGSGSGTLTQSIDQNQAYGQDHTYQNSVNGQTSGNSMMTINITDNKDVARFSFKGTGFEFISRTNSYDSASFAVEVWNKADLDEDGVPYEGKKPINKLPVITEYTSVPTKCSHSFHNTNGFCTYCGKSVSHTYPVVGEGVQNPDAKCTICGAAPTKFYLNGWINNENYTGDEYEFVDGKLTTTFAQDSYVIVRDGNDKEYWTHGYQGNVTSTLMFSELKEGNGGDKLRVPGGVEIEFTLVDNGTGGVILSYATADQAGGEKTLYFDNTISQWDQVFIYYWSAKVTNMVVWPGIEMQKVEGTENIYSYVVPADAEQVIFNKGLGGAGNQTSDMTIPGDGYVYNNGTWSVYGSSEDLERTTYKLYFENVDGWENIYAYTWGGATSTQWPGAQLNPVEGSTTTYFVEIPADSTGLIFNNNSGSQTKDLCIYGDGYTYNGGAWFNPQGEQITSKTVYYVNKSNWETVYIYSWTPEGGSSVEHAGSWPGTAMSNVPGSNLWFYELPESASKVIFNNGAGDQTGNLDMVGTTPTFNDDSHDSVPLNQTIYFENTNYWSQVYVHYWNDVGVTSQWPGVKMNYIGNNIYSAVLPITAQNVSFNSGFMQTRDYKTVYFKNNGDWQSVNVSYWSTSDRTVASKDAVAMSQITGTDYWSIEIPAAANRIVFSNGADETAKTAEQALDGSKPVFDMASTAWTNVIPAELTRTVYYENVNAWDDVSIHYWSNDGGTVWPGDKMTLVEGTTNLYMAEVPVGMTNVIFNGVYKAESALPLDGSDMFSNNQWYIFTSGEKREIYQVPVIRIAGLPYGEYTVKISGMPTYKDDTDWNNITKDDIKTTYLYVDGIRIFQPMGATNLNYAPAENGADFNELRNLILNGQAALVTSDVSSSVYTGNGYTWTENRNGSLFDFDSDETTVYQGNKLSSIDDYMVVGPNNEVYMNGNLRNEAIVFYVTEKAGVTNRTVQIAARALDAGLITSSDPLGVEATLYQGVKINKPDGTESYGWNAIDKLTSGTEQYYTIDYSACPYTEANGVKTYQVALYIRSGMASFTSVKTNGFTIPGNELGTVTDLYYKDGSMMEVLSNKVVTNMSLDLASIAQQMSTISFNNGSNNGSNDNSNDSNETPEIPAAPDASVKPTLKPAFPTMALEEEVKYNIYFAASELDDVVQMGLAAFDSKVTNGTVADADYLFPGYVQEGAYYMAQTDGIAAKNMGDAMYLRIYAELADGSYVYSPIFHFNAVDYVKTVLSSDNYAEGLKQACVALMNYGADAQTFFGHNTGNLMNSFLSDDQMAAIGGFTSGMVSPIVKADAAKAGEFAAVSGGFNGVSPSVSLEGAFAVNYYFDPAKTVEGGMWFYYWDEDAYNSSDVLTKENACGYSYMSVADGEYCATLSGIAAKELDETVYVAATYECDGVTYSTGVLAVSVNVLCASQMGMNANLTALAQSMVIYSDYAKSFYGK